MPTVREYVDSIDRQAVVELWRAVFGYEAAHNEPSLVISKKVAMSDRLFFVAEDKDGIVGTVLAGYDGHRGWLYAVAVHPACGVRASGAASSTPLKTR